MRRGDRAMGARRTFRVAVAMAALLSSGCETLRQGGLPGAAGQPVDAQAMGASPGGDRLAEVIERAGLPRTLICSGTTWVAAGLGGFRAEYRLVPVVPAIEGYPLLRERGTREGDRPCLYLRAGRTGSTLAQVYVRYEPGR